MQETDRRIKETQDRERVNLNKVILEERKWYCGFVAAFSKSLVSRYHLITICVPYMYDVTQLAVCT